MIFCEKENDFLTLTKAKSTLVRSEVVKLLRPSLGLLRGPELLCVPMWKVGERCNQVDNLLSAIWNSWFNQLTTCVWRLAKLQLMKCEGWLSMVTFTNSVIINSTWQYRKLKEGIGIELKRKADHWPTKIYSVFPLVFIRQSVCLRSWLADIPPALSSFPSKRLPFMLSVKQAGYYLLFPPFCQKGGGGDPELKKQKLKRLPLEYDIQFKLSRG